MKRKRTPWMLFLASLAVVIVLVGGLQLLKSDKKANNAVAKETPGKMNQLGKEIYDQHCMACHQKDGSGVSAMYPPVVQNPRVLGDKQQLIKIILEGQEGQIEVNGQVYNGVMAPYDFLSNEEVASVLTYIRKNFKNDAKAISPEEVQQVRASLE